MRKIRGSNDGKGLCESYNLATKRYTCALVRNAESQVPTHPNRTPGGFTCAVKFGKCCSEGLFSTMRAVIRAPACDFFKKLMSTQADLSDTKSGALPSPLLDRAEVPTVLIWDGGSFGPQAPPIL